MGFFGDLRKLALHYIDFLNLSISFLRHLTILSLVLDYFSSFINICLVQSQHDCCKYEEDDTEDCSDVAGDCSDAKSELPIPSQYSVTCYITPQYKLPNTAQRQQLHLQTNLLLYNKFEINCIRDVLFWSVFLNYLFRSRNTSKVQLFLSFEE